MDMLSQMIDVAKDKITKKDFNAFLKFIGVKEENLTKKQKESCRHFFYSTVDVSCSQYGSSEIGCYPTDLFILEKTVEDIKGEGEDFYEEHKFPCDLVMKKLKQKKLRLV